MFIYAYISHMAIANKILTIRTVII